MVEYNNNNEIFALHVLKKYRDLLTEHYSSYSIKTIFYFTFSKKVLRKKNKVFIVCELKIVF